LGGVDNEEDNDDGSAVKRSRIVVQKDDVAISTSVVDDDKKVQPIKKETDDNPVTMDKGEDVDDDDDTSAVQQAIRRTQKKQKILSSLPLTSSSTSSSGIPGYGDNSRNKGRMGGKGSGNNSNNRDRQTEELSILANKHKKNMEEFIEQNIAAKISESTHSSNGRRRTSDDDNGDGDGDVVRRGHDTIQDEDDLYQQLARETYTGNQVTSSDGTTSQLVDDEDKGAVLVGSGIAEVILPVHERLASLDRPGRTTMGASVRNKYIPSSSSAVPEGERNSLPKTTPTPAGRNMVTSLQRQQQQLQLQEQQQQQRLIKEGGSNNNNNNNNSQAAGGSKIDTTEHGRRGFAEFLGKTTTKSSTPTDPSISTQHGHYNQNHSQHRGPNSSSSSSSFHRGQQQNRDDQVFSKFVTRHFQENRR
jgi:hypothetical protein